MTDRSRPTTGTVIVALAGGTDPWLDPEMGDCRRDGRRPASRRRGAQAPE